MATAKQIAARKLFAKRAKAGEFKRKANPGAFRSGAPRRKAAPAETVRGIFDVQEWTRLRNSRSGNPVWAFVLQDRGSGALYEGRTKPDADYAYGLPSSPSALSATLRRMPSGVYVMLDGEKALGRMVVGPDGTVTQNPRGRSAKGVKRASQATGKAPSARLVKRRKATKRAPAGFYANPSPTRAPGAFEVWTVKHGVRDRYVATFIKKSDAVAYARAYADAHSVAVGIRGAK